MAPHRTGRLGLALLAQVLARCQAHQQFPLGPGKPALFPPLSPIRLPLTGAVPPGQSAVERAEALKPIAWLHVPKDGSSFFNCVLNNPTICPNRPANRYIPDHDESITVGDGLTDGPVPFVLNSLPVDSYCPGSFSNTFTEWDGRGHTAVGSVWEQNRGRVVAMLRQPEQRMISAHNFHLDEHHMGWQPIQISDVYEYAMQWQGCLTKMITRGGHPCFDPFSQPPTPEESALAVERIRTGFAFVGILEEWQLSVCLFHAMYGGWCDDKEFGNMRMGPGRTSSDDQYDTSALRGWTDPADGPVYAEAVRVFNENLERFGVTRENCPSSCRPPQGHQGVNVTQWSPTL